MKHYRDYKKQFSLFIILTILLPIVFLSAQTVQELSSKINEHNNTINKLEREIAQYQDELDGLGKQKDSLNKSIKELDLTRKKLMADIAVTENKIANTNIKITSLSSQIVNKEDSIKNNQDAVSLGLKRISESEQSSLVEVILSNKDFTYSWNDVDQIISLREKINKKTEELKQIKGELEDTRTETITAKNELVALKNKLADQKKIVDQNTAEKKKLLAQTKNSESNYQKILKDRLAKKETLEKEVFSLESQLKYILDPSKLPNKGILSWPLDKFKITQLFGVTSDSGRLYKSGSHSGVDLGVPVGTPVRSMADGIVLGTGDTDATCVGTSFGKWVLIKYNNGLASAYGHLSLIKTYKGAKVSRGEIVAYSGNTGHSTGPHLHVAVYAGDAVKVQNVPSTTCSGRTYTMPIAPTKAYLDPMYYLPKK